MSQRILYLQYTNPTAYPPLESSSGILANDGWTVLFFGIQSRGSGNFAFPEHENIEVRLMASAAPGFRQKWHFLCFLWKCWAVAREFKPDWVYVSDAMAAPAGLVLKRLGYRVVYHEHDSPTPGAVHSTFMGWVMRCRRRLARKADINVLPQAERMRIFREGTGTERPIYCVWNCPRRVEVVSEGHRTERRSGEALKLYFHGSINLERVPLSLIEGAKRSGVPVTIRVVGYETIGSRGSSEKLQEAADAAGELVELELPGPMSRHELGRQMEGMHAGWICCRNEGNDVNLRHLVGASNKAFDYLAAGLAILVWDDPEWTGMFETPGYARSCDPGNPESIAGALKWMYDHPREVYLMGERGRRRILAEWNYETVFDPVLALMNRR